MLFLWLLLSVAVGQAASLAELSYPETIIYNAKIVTVSNADFSTNVGTIAQAMAIRAGKILAVGSDTEIRELAGPKTKSIDLKGRAVLPGLISTHEHPADWAPISPRGFGRVITDSEMVARYVGNLTPKEQLTKLQPLLVEAVSKAKPRQWVRIYMYRGKMKEYSGELTAELPRIISRSYLDSIAPNNPVEVKGAFNTILNSKAIQELLRVHPGVPFLGEAEKATLLERGVGGIPVYRALESGVLFENNLPLLARTYKAEMEFWATLGMTAFDSASYDSISLRAFRYLDERGEMPIRYGWGYVGPNFSPDVLDYLASLIGHGTDYLWLTGAWPAAAMDCTTINARPEVKQQERCVFTPGSKAATDMYNVIKSGLRIASMHTGGDKDIDYLLDIIEKASADAGFTPDQIRAKRHTFDHSGMAPRPAQYERIKKLGIMFSVNSAYHYWYTPEVAAAYGEEYTAWVGPRKSMSDYGIMNSFEVDAPFSQEDTTLFEAASYSITRRAKDGKVHGSNERIDRERLLKAMTIWGAHNLMREKVLGSLEPGKFADLIVIDRDYMTIPEEEISKVKVLAAMVGGKFVYVSPSFSSAYGLSPVGYQP